MSGLAENDPPSQLTSFDAVLQEIAQQGDYDDVTVGIRGNDLVIEAFMPVAQKLQNALANVFYQNRRDVISKHDFGAEKSIFIIRNVAAYPVDYEDIASRFEGAMSQARSRINKEMKHTEDLMKASWNSPQGRDV